MCRSSTALRPPPCNLGSRAGGAKCVGRFAPRATGWWYARRLASPCGLQPLAGSAVRCSGEFGDNPLVVLGIDALSTTSMKVAKD